MTDWTDVCAVDQLPPGAHKRVDVDDVMVAVFNIEGEYLAIEDACSHDGGELACGLLEGEVIICPRHGSRFNLRTGAVLSAPAYEDIPVFPVRCQQGRIEVRDPRWD